MLQLKFTQPRFITHLGGVDGNGFQIAIILPKGTNYEKPAIHECPLLWGSNKWLLAHPDSPEAKQGAYIGLKGENLTL